MYATCKKCGGEMVESTALQQGYSGVPDFPGKTAPKVERFGPIVEHLTMDGQIMRLGGKEATAHAQIVTSEGKSENAEMSIEIGKQLRKYLWGKTIRFSGVARWERRDDEIWHLLQYKITSFEPIEDESLAEATKKLRALESSDWSKVQDIDAHICDMRGDSVH